jgi:hypothetical protein
MKTCKFCQIPLTKKFQVSFCTISCAAKNQVKLRKEVGWKHSDETVNRIRGKCTASNARIHGPKRVEYATNPKKCCICQKSIPYIDRFTRSTCSKECNKKRLTEIGRMGGKISAAKQTRRSKREIEMYELCKNHFKNVDHNKPIFNEWDADILIYDHKIAVMWNGDWHYIEMSFAQSLLQVQTRDAYRIKQILKEGWIPYTIEDSTKNPKTPKQAFIELLEFIDKMVARDGTAPPLPACKTGTPLLC